MLGLYEVRDGLLYRAQMFYFDTAAVRKFLQSNDDHTLKPHDAVIRVYDAAGNVIATHEHEGEFKEW